MFFAEAPAAFKYPMFFIAGVFIMVFFEYIIKQFLEKVNYLSSRFRVYFTKPPHA